MELARESSPKSTLRKGGSSYGFHLIVGVKQGPGRRRLLYRNCSLHGLQAQEEVSVQIATQTCKKEIRTCDRHCSPGVGVPLLHSSSSVAQILRGIASVIAG